MLMFILGMIVGVLVYLFVCYIYMKRKKITHVHLNTTEQEQANVVVMKLYGDIRYSTGLRDACKLIRDIQEENPDLTALNAIKLAGNVINEKYDEAQKSVQKLADICGYSKLEV